MDSANQDSVWEMFYALFFNLINLIFLGEIPDPFGVVLDCLLNRDNATDRVSNMKHTFRKWGDLVKSKLLLS